MVKSGNLNDKELYLAVAQELEHFNNLVKGHAKLLRAIAGL